MRAHREGIALEQDILVRDAAGVVLDQTQECQGMGSVQAEVGVTFLTR